MSSKRPLGDEPAPDAPDAGSQPDPGTAVTDEDTEGQSFHNYELVRAISRERTNEAQRLARDSARAREAREAKRPGR